jgi:hypothetical protein
MNNLILVFILIFLGGHEIDGVHPHDAGIEEGLDVDLSGPHPNVFLEQTLSVVSGADNLAFFNGHVVKKELGKGLALNSNTRVRKWSEVVNMVNNHQNKNMKNYTSNQAIHMHNELMAGDFLELFQRDGFDPKRKLYKKGTIFSGSTFKQVVDSCPQLSKPLVLTNTVDENWGFLSTPIGTRTARWINMTNHLRIHHSNYETVRTILDWDKIVMVLTNAHIDPQIGMHRKLLSLPLGVRHRVPVFKAMQSYVRVNKTKLFTINNSGWKERTSINNYLIKKFATFNVTIMNTFPKKTSKAKLAMRPLVERQYKDHYMEVASSKFALCPSGLSMDSYRLWETLALGSIPVVESNMGFDRTYSNLPVLVVHNYTDLTPKFLEEAYPCFYKNAKRYKYMHLTKEYWHKLIHRAVRHGNAAHVQRMHPFRNAYCDFLPDKISVSAVRPDGRSAQPV